MPAPQRRTPRSCREPFVLVSSSASILRNGARQGPAHRSDAIVEKGSLWTTGRVERLLAEGIDDDEADVHPLALCGPRRTLVEPADRAAWLSEQRSRRMNADGV